jgi:hypothetical protein
VTDRKPTQAMPADGRKGAPDGVNTQANFDATGGSDAAAPYPNPHTGKSEEERDNLADGFFGHGGQSSMGYHGPQQLGAKDVKPGGNDHAGTKKG